MGGKVLGGTKGEKIALAPFLTYSHCPLVLAPVAGFKISVHLLVLSPLLEVLLRLSLLLSLSLFPGLVASLSSLLSLSTPPLGRECPFARWH